MFYSLLLFCFISFLYSQLLVFFDFIGLFNHIKLGELRELSFGGVSVFGLNMIVFYYLFVALIEELSKHINFLGTSLGFVKTINKGVLYTFFVALGFVFLENILYIYNTYIAYGLSSDTITVYFSRSVFSLMLHIFCSGVIAYYFSKAYLEYGKSFNLGYVKNLLIGIFFSVLLHSFFDISLEFGWTFVMILYFVFGYFYITSIFYKS
ncbi:MAG: PrsW family glutamic-type intramembrane protease [Candidatus Gracilibacteria bacterium]|nr:PrsW family glutamic-type intramembrane protease [Candidatus Gracilibacteria bacterium]